MLSAHKTKRLAQERDKTAKQRYFLLEKEYNAVWSTTDLREPFPALGDIITNRIFEDLIWDTPDTEALTDVFFREKLSQYLPRIIEEWRPAKVQELVEVMQKSRPTASAADLHLATSVFECPDCRAKMQYPQIFYHFCCVYNPVPNSLSEERIKKIYSYDNKARMSHKVVFSESGSRIVKTIVESCSLDPATTTIQDLHSANPLIECPACYLAPMQSYYELGRSFMRWPYAVGIVICLKEVCIPNASFTLRSSTAAQIIISRSTLLVKKRSRSLPVNQNSELRRPYVVPTVIRLSIVHSTVCSNI